MGDKWVKETAERLFRFYGTTEDGDLRGSSTYIGAAIATFCPEIPLITGKELLSVVENTGSKTPFGLAYVDFGVQVDGEPETNSDQARVLQEDYKLRGIDNSEIWVPDFKQLVLVPDRKTGLVFRLADSVEQKDLTPASKYNFKNRIGKDGLFGAYLNDVGVWCANGVGLADSYEYGRGVRYDAEGVVPAEISAIEKSLVNKLVDEFGAKLE